MQQPALRNLWCTKRVHPCTFFTTAHLPRPEARAWLWLISSLTGCVEVRQAMSSGLPVVAVAAGGLVDILRNTVGEAGAPLITPPGQPSSPAC